MGPQVLKNSVKKEEPALRRGTIGKLTTELRKKIPDAKTIVNNFYLNKAKQVNKIVIKNKTAAPLNVESHSNDVYMSYSPAIFQEAVKVVTDSLKENESFETDKMTIKVIKVMPSIDLNKIKTIDLIT